MLFLKKVFDQLNRYFNWCSHCLNLFNIYISSGKLDRNIKAVNIVIADAPEHAPSSIIDSAVDKAVPIVNAGWIIESLIQGNKAPFKQFVFNK